ncbi:MAG: PIG-L family deacetylase, partial [Chloroflexota bacterium]|nr:PIG-L family deacetylase [Chloroflexota bacterium]
TAVFDKKQRAMEAIKAQSYLRDYYTERAVYRANHARRAGGASDIRYAEAFQRVYPQVVAAL